MRASLVILLFPLLISANMWDNLFDGQGVPFQLPYNFSATLFPTGLSEIVKYDILSITEKNGLSINTTLPFATTNETVASQMKFNFTKGIMTAYSPQRGCVMLKDDMVLYNNSFYSAIEGILELVLLLNSQDQHHQYKKVDINLLLKFMNVSSCVSNLALYFLGDNDLHLIESTFSSGLKSSFTVENMRSQQTNLSEYQPQAGWECEKMRVVKTDGKNYVVPDNWSDSSDGSDSEDSSDDSNSNLNIVNSSTNTTTQSESLSDLLLDYLLPVELDAQQRKLISEFLEEFLKNYVDC